MTGLSKEVSFVLTIVLAALATCAFAQIPNATPPESRVWFGKWENKVAEGTLDVAKTRATVAVDIPTTVFLTNGTDFPFTKLSIEDREYVASALGTSPRFFRKYAFIVASASYGQMPPIEAVENDGKAVCELVVEKLGFDPDDVVYLRNDKDFSVNPTKDIIEDKFRKFVAELEPDSFVFVYFAGHGCQDFSTGETFFIPCDAKSDETLKTSVSLNKLFRSICENESGATPWFVVDACREELTRGSADKLIKFENGECSYYLMQACSKGAYAIENGDHGFFTQALLEAFDGECDYNKDRIVALDEVWSYAYNRTQELSEKRQIPKHSAYDFDSVSLLNLDASIPAPVVLDKLKKKSERSTATPAPSEDVPLKEEYLNRYGMTFKLIPAGTFMMGDSISPTSDFRLFQELEKLFSVPGPEHKVTLSSPFYMGVYEVTVGNFDKFVKATGYKTTAEKEGNAVGDDFEESEDLNWTSPGFRQTLRDPVVCVSYDDACAYIDWLNENDAEKPLGFEYALPTEAQWEYACRGGKATLFFWGNDLDKGEGYINALDEDKSVYFGMLRFPFSSGYRGTCPVDADFLPNPYGLYHMLGNVWEWCADWSSLYDEEPVVDPLGGEKETMHIYRGGGWRSAPYLARSAVRNRGLNGSNDLGFRPALVRRHAEPQTKPQISTEGRFNFIE